MLNVTFYTKNTETDKVSVTIQDKCQLETITSAKNFYADSDITDFSYPLPSLIDGEGMFKNSPIESFNSDLHTLVNGKYMFNNCTKLAEFNSDLPSLSDGNNMFAYAILADFTTDLPSLTNGNWMFYHTALESFSGDLSSLENGEWMFAITPLQSFNGDLSSLENGHRMFYATDIASFNNDLPSLTNGSYMFYCCYSLTSFSGDLSSLEDGENMFSYCKLDAPSVLNIAESINNEVIDAPLRIGIGCSTDMSDLNSFAQEVYYDNWHDLCRTFYDKGWTVTWEHTAIHTVEDTGEHVEQTGEHPTIYTKYNDCVDVSEVTAVNSSYKTDLRNGEWVYLLDNLTTGRDMFYFSAIESFNSDLSSLTNGTRMFYMSSLTSFSGDLSNLTDGGGMFGGTRLTSFNEDLPSLTNGGQMFYATPLTSFNGDLSSLTNGQHMFYNSALESFNGDLSSLENGYNMFHNSALESFSGDLSKLTNGSHMFYATPLTSFNGDLSNLTNGDAMLYGTKLASFQGDLSSLETAINMFSCTSDQGNTPALDTESVMHIANTIKDWSGDSATHQIDINIANTTPSDEEDGYFTEILNKGWDLLVNGYNYTPANAVDGTSTGALIDGEETTTPIAYWAKPIEVAQKVAHYVSTDGKYYNIVGGQFIYVKDPETYGQFTSREHAVQEITLGLGLTEYTYVEPSEE